MELRKLNWQTWLKHGDEYRKAVSAKSKVRFGTDIRYNLISMAFESYIMAILDYHQSLPENHTFLDLISGLESVMPVDETLKKRILQYESIQSICSIDKYSRTNPTEDEITDLTGAIDEISILAHKTCRSAA
jgi:hypothetical protein